MSLWHQLQKVLSTIHVTLEEGDNAEDIETVIQTGIQSSFSDTSFFEAIPEDTIFCPPWQSDVNLTEWQSGRSKSVNRSLTIAGFT